VVVAADEIPIRSAAELTRYLDHAADGHVVLLRVLRGRDTAFVAVQLPQPPGAEAIPEPQPTQAPAEAPAGEAAVSPAAPTIVIQVPPNTAVPSVVVGGEEVGAQETNPQPPSFSAPGVPTTPGATFPPGPGTPPQAYPQPGGVSQPPGPWLDRPLRPPLGTTTPAPPGAIGTGNGAAAPPPQPAPQRGGAPR
jgi:hypothetical protein